MRIPSAQFNISFHRQTIQGHTRKNIIKNKKVITDNLFMSGLKDWTHNPTTDKHITIHYKRKMTNLEQEHK